MFFGAKTFLINVLNHIKLAFESLSIDDTLSCLLEMLNIIVIMSLKDKLGVT